MAWHYAGNKKYSGEDIQKIEFMIAKKYCSNSDALFLGQMNVIYKKFKTTTETIFTKLLGECKNTLRLFLHSLETEGLLRERSESRDP